MNKIERTIVKMTYIPRDSVCIANRLCSVLVENEGLSISDVAIWCFCLRSSDTAGIR